jgi:hypothetical protein
MVGTSTPSRATLSNVKTSAVHLQNFKPCPHFDSIFHFSNYGHSSYHSGTLKVEKRYSRGLSLTSFYTWSKSIDEDSDDGAAGGVTFYNRRLEKGGRLTTSGIAGLRMRCTVCLSDAARSGCVMLTRSSTAFSAIGNSQAYRPSRVARRSALLLQEVRTCTCRVHCVRIWRLVRSMTTSPFHGTGKDCAATSKLALSPGLTSTLCLPGFFRTRPVRKEHCRPR